MSVVDGASSKLDRATLASPQAPAGLGHSESVPSAVSIPAISLWQPFASLIFAWDNERGDFAKCYETRPTKIPQKHIGRWVAVHATAKFPASRHISAELNDLCYDIWGCGYNFSLPLGAVIGKVCFGPSAPTDGIARFQPASELAAGDWAAGRWAWPILDARACRPIPAKGKQGWWRFPAQGINVPKEPLP